MLHSYLAYAIKIKIIARIKRVQDLRAFPSAASESHPQQVFLSVNAFWSPGIFIPKHKQKYSAVAAHGESCHLLVYFCIHHVNQFVSRPIVVNPEHRDFVTQVLLKSTFLSEDKFADTRMKTIGADDQIELPFTPILKSYLDASFVLFKSLYSVPKDRLDAALDLMKDQFSQVASRKADETSPRCPRKCVGRKAHNPFVAPVHDPYFPDYVSSLADFR